jgi:hypothetical protein
LGTHCNHLGECQYCEIRKSFFKFDQSKIEDFSSKSEHILFQLKSEF